MKIIKVLRVEDTRQYEEVQDDVWKPIPGTGIENQCARCGRSHEVHATVEIAFDDGTTGSMIVGTGCMTADETEFATKIRSVLNSQRTLAKLERRLAKYEALEVQRAAIMVEVDKLSVPPCEIRLANLCIVGRAITYAPRLTMFCGDGDAWLSDNHPTSGRDGEEYMAERRQCATWVWKEERAKERGMTRDMKNAAHYYIPDLKKRIDKQRKKIAELMAQKVSENSVAQAVSVG